MMTHGRGRVTAGLMIALSITQACGAGWHRPPQLTPGPLPARQQVQLWQHDQVLRWHAVTLTPDSVIGVPFLLPVNCDSCRLSVPRSTVDSIRLGSPTAGFWRTFGLVSGLAVAALLIVCATSGGGPPCSK